MDKKIIEKKGINAVSDFICNCGYLEDHLASNDKTLLWDGDLFVYSSKENLDTDHYRYAVKVQVKASEWKSDKQPKDSKYEIKIRDLRKYYEDGGVIFFKSLVGRDKSSMVFCSVLSRIQIQQIIDSAKGEKYTKIVCTKIPSAYEFLRDVESLHMQATHTIITPTELAGKNFRFHLNTPYVPSDLNYFSYLATSHNDVLVSIEGIPGEFYLNAPTRIQMGKVFHHSITVDGKEYFDEAKVEFVLEGIKCSIGKSVSILFPHKLENILPNEVTVSYNFSSQTILEAELELSFLIAVFKNRGFYIERCHVPLGDFKSSTIKKHIEAWSEMLKYVQRLKELFFRLGVIDDINFDTLTLEEAENFGLLMDAFLDEAIIDVDPEYDKKESYVENFYIAGIPIFVFMERLSDGGYKAKDIHECFDFSMRNQKGVLLQRPTLSILLERDDLPSNLGIQTAFKQYKDMIDADSSSYFFINKDLERMLWHFDQTGKIQYLMMAFQLFEILFDFEGGNTDLNIHTRIIGLEIYKRKNNSLKDSHKELLYEMDNTTKETYLKFAIAVLLEDLQKAEWLLKRMDSETREFATERSLFTLYKKIKTT